MTEVKAEKISVGYQNEKIIDHLSLTLRSREITTIIGANGCGKSTLLKALTRVHPIMDGQLLIDGKSIKTMSTKEVAKKIALLPQVLEATDGITVYELVSYGRFPHQKYLGNLSSEDKDKIHWAMEVTSVVAFVNMQVDELSGGQRQRVWIAMALAQDTDTIFLDEPTTYLDMNHQLEILELLSQLNQTQGKTIVMVLHDLNLSSRYSHNLIAMKNGNIKYQGNAKDVMTPDIIRDIFNIEAQLIDDPIYHKPTLLTYHLL